MYESDFELGKLRSPVEIIVIMHNPLPRPDKLMTQNKKKKIF